MTSQRLCGSLKVCFLLQLSCGVPPRRSRTNVSEKGIKAKVENKGQYDEYLRDLEPLREELGVNLKEDLYPDQLYTAGANTHQ
jgi:hypothetical protein